ncbi:MAG: hypothetical protein NC204_03520 [Candidatus Amulumruptor caecigallinarius]|nr:hypothetical protein [Candidatus Amulumruptor caecigallinarius]
MKQITNKVFNRRIIFMLAAIIVYAAGVCAQSANKIFEQAKAYQNTMTVASQNKAISLFSKARTIYDSKANKSKCDREIKKCNANIKAINGGPSKSHKSTSKSSPGKTKQYGEVVSVKPVKREQLDVDPEMLNLDMHSRNVSVNVDTNFDDWSVNAVTASDGTSFISVVKTTPTVFNVSVQPNFSTLTRTQKIDVNGGHLQREVVVTQRGRQEALYAKKNYVEIKKDGGSAKIEVMCNSDTIYDNGFNWFVESKPEWLSLNINLKKKASPDLKKITEDKLKGISFEKDPFMSKYLLTITPDAYVPYRPEATTGRRGEIVLRCGDVTQVIKVFHLGTQGK